MFKIHTILAISKIHDNGKTLCSESMNVASLATLRECEILRYKNNNNTKFGMICKADEQSYRRGTCQKLSRASREFYERKL